MVGWYHDSMDRNVSRLQEIVKDMHAAVHGVAKSWTRQRDRTTKQKPNLITFELFIREGEELVINRHLAEMW